MKCQKCKTEIKGKLKFCPQCGAPVKAKPKKTLFWTPGDEKMPDFKKKANSPQGAKPSSSAEVADNSAAPPLANSPAPSNSPPPPSSSSPAPVDNSVSDLPSAPMGSSVPLNTNNLNLSNSYSNQFSGNISSPNQSTDPHGAINFRNAPPTDKSPKKIVYIIIGLIWLLAIAGFVYYLVK